jgi:hypothetical protein
MKLVKSLLLGSAAGLIAVGGAQAADLPVKAKAVEYVKICSLYGAGFYYIPGTDTCIQIGGYVQVSTTFNSGGVLSGAYNGVAGAHNRLSNNFYARSRQGLSLDTRTATEYGVLRTFSSLIYSWTTSTDGIAGGSLGVYYAFIQFAGFTMGKAVSQFDAPWTNYPANIFDQLVGGSGDVTGVNQFTYTADFGQGVSAAISLQDPTAYYTTAIYNTSGFSNAGFFGGTGAATVYGTNSIGGTVAPDVVGMVRVDQAWGLFQASVAAHDNHTTYYGTTEPTGHPSDKWGWAAQLALSIKNIPTGAGDSINITGAYSNGASRYVFQSLVPVSYQMYGSTGNPLAYQSVGIGGVSDAVFAGTSAATGTGLELTTAYGIRGGYTHNWNPYWNSTLFGAWAAMRYTGAAKALICSPANFGAGIGCNPDFDIWQIGTQTQWTPVKGLAFTGYVVYTQLDQKFSGVGVMTAANTLAKPAAAYEFKDQSNWTFGVRAQRNF